MLQTETPLLDRITDQNPKLQACRVLRAAYAKGSITQRDGNVSVRDGGGDGFWISPSGVVKSQLEPSQLLHASRDMLACGMRPTHASGEFILHRLIQNLLPGGYDTVLHLHPTSMVAAMFAGWDLRELSEQFPEVTRYTRVGRNVPALAATSEVLALACAHAFSPVQGEMPHIVGLDRHGAVAIGRSAIDAFEHVERLEHVCQMVLASGVRPPNSHPAGVAVTAQCGGVAHNAG